MSVECPKCSTQNEEGAKLCATCDWLLTQPVDDSSADDATLKLRPRDELDYLIKSIEETSKHARTVLFLLAAACSYILIAAFGGAASEIGVWSMFGAGDDTLRLPMLEIDVSKEQFFMLSPILLLSLYLYLHIYIDELRQRLDTFAAADVKCAKLPDSFMMLFPWIGVFSHPRGNDDSCQNIRKTAWYIKLASGLLIWLMGPMAILALWFKFVLEEKAISIIPCLAVIVAGPIAFRQLWAGRTSSIFQGILGFVFIVATTSSVPSLRDFLGLGIVWIWLREALSWIREHGNSVLTVIGGVAATINALAQYIRKQRTRRALKP